MITDGTASGPANEVGEMFKTDDNVSKDNKTSNKVRLIGIMPWGVLAGKEELVGVKVSVKKSIYIV